MRRLAVNPPIAWQAALVCNHLDTEHIRCRAVNQRKGKMRKNEPAQVGINLLPDFGMIEQKIRRASDFGFKTLAQAGDFQLVV